LNGVTVGYCYIFLRIRFILINWTRADIAHLIQINKEENSEDLYVVWFDEPHLYPLGSFTYHTEHVRAYDIHRVIVYMFLLGLCSHSILLSVVTYLCSVEELSY